MLGGSVECHPHMYMPTTGMWRSPYISLETDSPPVILRPRLEPGGFVTVSDPLHPHHPLIHPSTPPHPSRCAASAPVPRLRLQRGNPDHKLCAFCAFSPNPTRKGARTHGRTVHPGPPLAAHLGRAHREASASRPPPRSQRIDGRVGTLRPPSVAFWKIASSSK